MKYGMRCLIGLALALAGAVAGFACGHTPGNPDTAPAGVRSKQTRVPGEYLVTLSEGAGVMAIADLYGRFGIKATKDLGKNIFLVTLTEDPGPSKMEELGRQTADIKAVQPNFVYQANGLENKRNP